MISEAEGQGQNGQGGIHIATCGEDRTSGNVEAVYAVNLAIRVDDATLGISVHTGTAEVVVEAACLVKVWERSTGGSNDPSRTTVLQFSGEQFLGQARTLQVQFCEAATNVRDGHPVLVTTPSERDPVLGIGRLFDLLDQLERSKPPAPVGQPRPAPPRHIRAGGPLHERQRDAGPDQITTGLGHLLEARPRV